ERRAARKLASDLRRSLDMIRTSYFNRSPNRCRARRAASGDGAFTLGNLSRQCQGRQASMMARLLVKVPLGLALRLDAHIERRAPGLVNDVDRGCRVGARQHGPDQLLQVGYVDIV